MAGISNKDASGYSKLEKLNYSGTSFTDESEIYFRGPNLAEPLQQAKDTLKKLANQYDKLAKEYNKIFFTCGTGVVRTMSLTDDISKDVLKFSKKLRKRADYTRDRVKTIEKAVDVARIAATDTVAKIGSAVVDATAKVVAAEQDS